MADRLKIMKPFHGAKKAYLVVFAFLFLFLIPGTSHAQCGFDSIGDYTCNQPTGGGGGGGGPITGGGPGYFIDNFLPTLPGAATCPAMADLPTIISTLPQSLQNSVVAQAISFFSATDNCSDITDFITNLLMFQGIMNALPLEICGSDPNSTGNDVTRDAVMAFMYNRIALDMAAGEGSNMSIIDVGVMMLDVCGLLQLPCPPGAGGGGGGTGGGGGGTGGGGTGGGGEGCTPVNSATIEDDIIDHLILREGVRECAYQDTEGHWTIGVGHLITDSDPYPRSTDTCITDAEVQTLLRRDMNTAYSAAQAQMAQLGLNCHDFLVDLVSVNFQLGTGWRSTFPTTWSLMQQGRYSEAADGLEGSLWNSQTPVRVDDFQEGLRSLDGGSPPPGSPPGAPQACAGGGGGDPADPNRPQADPLGFWCPDAGAAAYATDSTLPGTYNLSETGNARRIAESASLSIGATTGDNPDVHSERSGPGGLGCALAVSRILRCAGIDGIYSLATNGIWEQMEADSCWGEAVATGPLDSNVLQPGDVINLRTLGTPGGNGHVGIYVGDGQIISNGSGGYSGGDGATAGGVLQNYTVDSWNSRVVTRTSNPSAHSGTFRYTC